MSPGPDSTRPMLSLGVVIATATLLAVVFAFAARHPQRQDRNIWPGYADAEVYAARSLQTLKETQAAVEHWQRAVALTPGNASLHNELGNSLIALQKHADARHQYEEAVRLDPDYVDAHYNLANMLLFQGDKTGAQTQFETVIRLYPDHADAHYNLGFLDLGAGRVEAASKHYAEAVRLRPDHAPAQNSLGLTLLQLGRAREAVGHLEAALKADPQLSTALNNLAWLLATAPDASLRDGKRAVELATQADKIASGKSPGALKSLAAAYAETGQFAQALEAALRARALAQEQNVQELRQSLDECVRLLEAGQPLRDESIR